MMLASTPDSLRSDKIRFGQLESALSSGWHVLLLPLCLCGCVAACALRPQTRVTRRNSHSKQRRQGEGDKR